MTTIEKLARVLEPQAWKALGAADSISYQSRRTSSVRKATAILQALREPSLPMVQAVWTMSTDSYSHGAIFTAMIDAILAGEG